MSACVREASMYSLDDPLSYAPRYQLLLYDWITSHDVGPTLTASVEKARKTLVDSLWGRRAHLGGEVDRDRWHYWIAFSSYRAFEATKQRDRARSALFLLRAAQFSNPR